jgi:glycosyltransferase involved in cell wall biosynthesis
MPSTSPTSGPNSPDTAAREPLVAVGLPCYNSEKYLAQSIETLLAQSFKDFVLIISDNASTDGTEAICRRFAAQDSRIRYYRNETNIGMMPNFNRVFSLANSKYFKWATADDYWDSEMLAKSVAVMEADPEVVICYPRVVLVDAEGSELRRYEDQLHLSDADPVVRFLAVLERLGLVNHHLGVLRTAAIRRTQLFNTHMAADVGFVAEMSLYGKFFQLPDHLLFRRFHPESSSWQRGNQEHQAKRYHAANARRLPFNSWRFHGTFFRGVKNSPIGFGAKRRLVLRLLRTLYWNRQALGEELFRDLPLLWRRQNASSSDK